MSKMIQIRHVPDEVHEKLKKRAAKRRMTLSDYLNEELERLASTLTLDELYERQKQRPRLEHGLTAQDIVDDVRQSREERARYLDEMVDDVFGRSREDH